MITHDIHFAISDYQNKNNFYFRTSTNQMFSFEYLTQLKSKFSDCIVCDDLQARVQTSLNPDVSNFRHSGNIVMDIDDSLNIWFVFRWVS